MESVKTNPHMKNQGFTPGVIPAPNWHYKPVLYSAAQATKDFNQITYDIYQGRKKAESITNKKTPKSVFVFLGLGSLAVAFPFLKKLIKR